MVSENYNWAKVLAQRLSSAKELHEETKCDDKWSKNKERRELYNNYISNREVVYAKEPKSSKSRSRLRQKRSSCHNTKESDAHVSNIEKPLKIKDIWTTSIDMYKIVKMIGKGAFGKVMLAVHRFTGKNVAIKSIEKSYMKDEFSRRKVFQEVYILKKIRHSNVIRLYEVFESNNHLFMVMEYANKGDLLQYVKNRGRLSEKEARHFFKNILYGLGHCHCRSVLHRDVKLDNILIDDTKGIKICDFGVSKIIKKHQKIVEQWGTPAYIAPEIIADRGYHGFYVDIWSLGVLLYAMVWGAVPFKANDMQELYKNIMSKGFSFPVTLSKSLRHLIKSMLNKWPEKRILIPEILAHPWILSDEDFPMDASESENSSLLENSNLLSNWSDNRKL